MKLYSTLPTSENILNLLQNNPIGRNKDVFYFVRLLSTIDACCSISLNGNWGSGKTFFVKQAKLILDSFNPNSCLDDSTRKVVKSIVNDPENKVRSDITTAYYDAWENDNDDDPILSLLYATVTDDSIKYSPEKDKSLAKIFSTVAAAVINKTSGIDLSGTLSALEGECPFESIRAKKSVSKLLTEYFDVLISEHGNRLVFFIDELDRCKPEYAVRLLERIKHYFTDERVTFVFSVNLEQLQHTINKFYGESFNSSRYLDKLFDIRTSIPRCDIKQFVRYKLPSINTTYYYQESYIKVPNYFGLSIRESERFLGILLKTMRTDLHQTLLYGFASEKAVGFSAIYVVPFMIALNICSLSKYVEFIEGRNFNVFYDFCVSQYKTDRFKCLLEYDEQYEDLDMKRQKSVTAKEKLKLVYDAIFSRNDCDHSNLIQIGELDFEPDVINEIYKIPAMLSCYADYN